MSEVETLKSEEAELAAKILEAEDTVAEGAPAKQYTEDFVRELRQKERDKATRLRETEKQIQKLQQESAQESAKIKQSLEEMQKKTNDRLINAELKVMANKLGLRDVGDAKLADLSKISINENGDVVGVEEALANLKNSKGYLFEAPTTTNANYFGNAPAVSTVAGSGNDCLKMSPEEFQKTVAHVRMYGDFPDVQN